jgi:hypothetical protein
MPMEDTYCRGRLMGKLLNVLPDAQANEQVWDLEITRAAAAAPTLVFGVPGPMPAYTWCAVWHRSSGRNWTSQPHPEIGEALVHPQRAQARSRSRQRRQRADGGRLGPHPLGIRAWQAPTVASAG